MRVVSFVALVSSIALWACGPGDKEIRWQPAFERLEGSFLSSVWGTGPDDVYVVGGNRDFGEIRHFDGNGWTAQTLDDLQVLVWVHGFATDDIYAVGLGGSAAHFDGASWSTLEVPVDDDLWGTWGASPQDMWIVGGAVAAGAPLLLHYDGEEFTRYDLPAQENPLDAHAIFKVWGFGERIFAVGQRGLVIEHTGEGWKRVAAGEHADEDFVSLSGTSADEIFIAGGRGSARIASYNGSTFDTIKPMAISGLSAVTASDSGVFFGGSAGEALRFDPATQTVEVEAYASDGIHAMWDDGAGTVYAVGGLFAEPFTGIAYTRTEE